MNVTWDDRLITRHRAADLAGTWEMKMDYPYLRCGICDGNITKLPADGSVLNSDTVIAAVVRHMAGSHDYSLSGSGYGTETDAGAPDVARINRSNRRAGDPVYRPGY